MNPNNGKIDFYLAGTIVILLLIGMIIVFSASSMMAQSNYGSMVYFFWKQIIWAILAIFTMGIFYRIDYRILKKNKRPLFGILITIALLAGLYALGSKINGARRWYSLGFMNFQPSEFAKLTLIIYMAYFLASRGEKLREFKTGLLPLVTILISIIALVIFQPDMSTAMILAAVSGVMLFLSRAKLRHIVLLLLPVVPLIIFVLQTKKYQLVRISSWLSAWNDPMQNAYQVKQSLIGLGRGGFFGQGLGYSKQKFFFLPDSHTDFVFSILGEEFGFIGTTIILVLFLVIFYRGMRLAFRAPDAFGKFLAVGITINIVLVAFINASVVSMLLPATGIPMPFLSYGGSNLLFLGVGVGILLNISRQTEERRMSSNWSEFSQKREQFFRTVITAD